MFFYSSTNNTHHSTNWYHSTVNLEKIDTTSFMKAPTSIVHEELNQNKSPSNVIANPDPPPVFNEFKRPAIKLNMKTLKSKIRFYKIL